LPMGIFLIRMQNNIFLKSLIFFGTIILFQTGAALGAAEKITEFKVTGKNGKSAQKMIITTEKNSMSVRFIDSAGESSVNTFSQDLKALETKYFDTKSHEYLKVTFNNMAHKIISEGTIDKTYELEDPVYDGNGAIFYVFSKILPAKDKILTFNLLQSKEKRIVKMYLKYLKQEKININGKMLESNKYETGLVNRVLVFFWPYKYHYWFSTENGEMLRYEGPVGHENSEIIEQTDSK
jgi:hypothetical protein